MRSTTPICAWSAGTKEPIWAMRVMSATCLSAVLLPLMFGPVMISNWWSLVFRSTSFGTKRSSVWYFSTTGWRPLTMRIVSPWSTWGRT
ncbi:MAG: hypothetical protein BWZ09_02778 [Alphaproteobacteria bacterium ADurb.BinA305]|nr:MAG: hypothetical protein BWZ09_02778 [Alphaproteobacteria bacterium ADurb.BinA305]